MDGISWRKRPLAARSVAFVSARVIRKPFERCEGACLVNFEAIFDDPYFRSLLKKSGYAPLLRRDLLESPQPVGLSPEKTWECLYLVNRAFGLEIPMTADGSVPDGAGASLSWYRETSRMYQLSNTLLRHCNPDSLLAKTLSDGSLRQFMVKMRVEDIIASARLDGLSVDAGEADALMHDTVVARNATEQVLINAFRLDGDIAGYLGRNFSVEMIEEITGRLLDGVAVEDIEFGERSWGLAPRGAYGSSSDLERIIAYAIGEIGDPADSPLVRGFFIVDSLRYSRVGGMTPALAGRVLARLYYTKHDLPVLGLLPINRARVMWEEGLLPREATSCTRGEHLDTVDLLYRRKPVDVSWHALLSLELSVYELDNAMALVEEWRLKDERVKEALAGSNLFNHRQRSMIARAQANPGAEFVIRYHQSNHDVAYATARKDFLELEASGYLVREKRGKTYVFRAGPKLGG